MNPRGGELRTSVAVVGAGAVGGVFAWALHKAGHDVSLCVRAPFEELVVHSPAGEECVPVRVVKDPQGLRPVRWVLLAVKSYDTESTERWLSALCDEDTTVVVLQNGVEQEERVHHLAPQASFVPALVYIAGERLAPGRIRVRYFDGIDVPETSAAERLVDLFKGSGVDVRLRKDLITAAWRKLMLNVAVNPITQWP
jgi:2-dehydropantoate 2-reductase